MRKTQIERNTNETKIKMSLNIDGTGENNISTGSGFFDHMMELFAKHGRFDIDLNCNGDTNVDFHHSCEDIGISLGQAFCQALGDKKGIVRYSNIYLPMDEALVLVVVDISGRGILVTDIDFPSEKIGEFDTELVKEFLLAFTRECGVTLHVKQMYGENSHHIAEGIFKGLGRALNQATAIDEKYKDEIPSTKGVL